MAIEMIPVEHLRDPDAKHLADRARSFLSEFGWCRSIEKMSLGFSMAPKLGVFRVAIEPAAPDVDRDLWLIVGDVPSAYLIGEVGETWQEALSGYVEEVRLWIAAAENGESVEDLIPVNVPPTPEYAAMLRTRLDFVEQRLLAVDPEELESDA